MAVVVRPTHEFQTGAMERVSALARPLLAFSWLNGIEADRALECLGPSSAVPLDRRDPGLRQGCLAVQACLKWVIV